MKKIILFVLLVLFISSSASAKVYMAVDKKSKEIYSMSKHDDFISVDVDDKTLSKDDVEYIILDGDLDQYPLEHHPIYYKYTGKKFILNVKKLSDDTLAKEKNAKKIEEIEKISNRAKLNAMKELESEGVEFEEATEDDFK